MPNSNAVPADGSPAELRHDEQGRVSAFYPYQPVGVFPLRDHRRAKKRPLKCVATVKRILLLRRGAAAQRGVTAGEAAEAHDLVMVALGEGKDLGVTKLGELDQPPHLIINPLAVHQRHQQELSLFGAHAGVPLPFEANQGQVQCDRVRGECFSAATTKVAAELVEHDDRGKQVLGSVAPSPCLSCQQLAVERGKPRTNALVEDLRLSEPALAPDLAEPEIKNCWSGIGGGILDSHASPP